MIAGSRNLWHIKNRVKLTLLAIKIRLPVVLFTLLAKNGTETAPQFAKSCQIKVYWQSADMTFDILGVLPGINLRDQQ